MPCINFFYSGIGFTYICEGHNIFRNSNAIWKKRSCFFFKQDGKNLKTTGFFLTHTQHAFRANLEKFFQKGTNSLLVIFEKCKKIVSNIPLLVAL